MSDRTLHTEMHGLTAADLDRALATSRARGAVLVRRRHRRVVMLGTVAAGVLLLGGFGMLRTLADDNGGVVVDPAGRGDGKVLAPATSTTTTSSVPTTTVPEAPMGFERRELGAGVVRIDNTTPPLDALGQVVTTTTAPIDADVAIAPARSETRDVAITGSERTGDHSLWVSFECDPLSGYLDHVVYRRAGSVVTVEVTLTGVTTGLDCSGGRGIELFFPGEALPADVSAVGGHFDE